VTDLRQQLKDITPYKPIPYRDGCKNQRTYDEPFEDSVGNKAIVTRVDYIDKKGKQITGYLLRIKWIK
jgi:hypothetical protein